MNEGSLGILRLISVAIQNVGFAVIVGALLSSQWLARGASTWQDGVGLRLLMTLRVASIGSLLSSVLSFWAHCALMSDSTLLEAGPAVWSMLVGTGFGHVWLVGAVFTLCIVVLSFLRSGNETRFPLVMWISLAIVALARSNSGHPVDAGFFSLPVWVDWLHLLAISAWVGLVLITTYVVMPHLLDAPGSEMQHSASFVQSLSDAATYALFVLFSTGAYNGWRGVNAPSNLLESTYGQLLLLKLALVLIAAALGGHNRFFEMPKLMSALRSPSATEPTGLLRRFGLVLHVESIVLAGVVLVAAVLVSSPLPGTT
ncbi:copper resistance protein CopD [Trinickia dabaoshanensis]|uniref:Copper resistance protein CopD n=1 Tax=Trinickia dabaoshanensis TaxID=564714 RepID=A0A2N7VRC8_9BURK|nr:CopD family protein [Trinickia dabaoshanensis]PMS19700.1 copper resistance protein CopD [Trinickia dabaoshanensis]TAM50917.1 MAG: copper resistance protein CopD [Paraburkholderia sp.]